VARIKLLLYGLGMLKPPLSIVAVVGGLLSGVAFIAAASHGPGVNTFGRMTSGSKQIDFILGVHVNAIVALCFACWLLSFLCIVLFICVWRLSKDVEKLKNCSAAVLMS
jgi:hypothetical protein